MTSADTSSIDTPAETGDELLTPFPRRNHLARMRRARNRRRARVGLGATLALTLTLSGTGLAASWATPAVDQDPLVDSAAAVAQANDELRAEQTAQQSAKETLESASSVLDKADESVDTEDLATYVDRLSEYRTLTPTFTTNLVKQTEAETASVAEDSEAAKRRKAEEAEKRAAEEAARRAAANTPEGAKATAKSMAAETYGWGAGEFSCLVSLWNKESGWSHTASNPSSGAYGIPQALPGSKMSSVASDWKTNATTQITWGLQYISSVYGSPCSAWGHSQATGWY